MKQSEPFKIFAADVTHIDFLSDFGRKSFIDAYKNTLSLNELEEYAEVAFSRSHILDEINGSSATYFICRDIESNLCGYSKLIPSHPPECITLDNCIELQRLYVDENYRGQGVGRLLSLHGELNARNRGVLNIWLRVWEGNIHAQKIYLQWNYSIVGEEQYQVGADERTVVLMCKPLSDEQ